MRGVAAALVLLLLGGGCSHLTRLSSQRITGEHNYIFIRPFSAKGAPDEVAKLISEAFYSRLTAQEVFRGSGNKTYRFDFYLGQACPEGYDCYYITGEVSDYKYEEGCCGRDGVETVSAIRFWDDLTKKPLFEISEWNSEVFDPVETTQLNAIELLAEDSVQTLVNALLKAL